MKRIAPLIVICTLFTIGAITGCVPSSIKEVTFDQLFSDPNGNTNKEISIEGFYFHGFEIVVLSERLEYSGFAAGHLVPKGRMVWIAGGIPKEVYDELTQQQMMGPSERYGKLVITGKFEYGGQYGHLGGFDFQITPREAKLLSWSLSETKPFEVPAELPAKGL